MAFNYDILDYGDELQVRFYSYTMGRPKRIPLLDDNEILFEYFDDEVVQLPDWFDFDNVQYFEDHSRALSRDEVEAPLLSEDDIKLKKETSLRNSVNRSKESIFQYSNSNPWEWFVTLTFDSEKIFDRYDYSLCLKTIRKWLNNLTDRVCPGLMYVIVPEKHKDGAIHFHGLFACCDNLKFIDSGKYEYMGHIYSDDKLRPNSKVRSFGKKIFNLKNWRYGFSNCTKIIDSHRASAYLTKYITKDLIIDIPHKSRYLHSNNLARPSHNKDFITPEEKEKLITSWYEEGRVVSSSSSVNPGFGLVVNYFTIKK